MQRVDVALQLGGLAAGLLSALPQHVPCLLRISISIVHDAARRAPVSTSPPSLLPQQSLFLGDLPNIRIRGSNRSAALARARI